MTCMKQLMLLSLLFLHYIVITNAFFHSIESTKSHTTTSLCRGRGINRLNNRQFASPNIAEFTDEDGAETEKEEKVITTHGYEGDYLPGDIVRVKNDMIMWHIKKYKDEGLNVKGYVGTVGSLELYGRKLKTLCSAITPVKTKFEVDGEGQPAG